MKKSQTSRHFLLGLVALLLALVVTMAGCASKQQQESKKDTTPATPPQAQAKNVDTGMLVEEWESSGHAQLLQNPAGRDDCITCHSGDGFAKKISKLSNLPEGRVVKLPATAGGTETIISISPTECEACHTGQGAQLKKSGQVDIPSKKNISAGKAALCMACHNSRHAPDKNNAQQFSPHHGPQADVLLGSGGVGDGFKLTNSPHAGIDNSCVHCHMPDNDNKQASHTWKMDEKYIKQTCGQCHSGLTTFNRKADGDYDGNGKTEGIQDEVTGLLKLVKGEIEAKLNGGSFDDEHGAIVFKDKSGKQMKGPADVYQAAYNYILISNDNSKGVHNPSYVVQLLQQSYKLLAGKDVPNAKML